MVSQNNFSSHSDDTQQKEENLLDIMSKNLAKKLQADKATETSHPFEYIENMRTELKTEIESKAKHRIKKLWLQKYDFLFRLAT